MMYYVIKEADTDKYYNQDWGKFTEIFSATEYDKEEFAYGIMQQYIQHFKGLHCKIEKIYYLS